MQPWPRSVQTGLVDQVTPRPTLHLSGPKLRLALERLLQGSEKAGGIERWVAGLRFKVAVFERALERADDGVLDEQSFIALCALMPSVRRRIGSWLSSAGFEALRDLTQRLLIHARDTQNADSSLGSFCAAFPATREYRFVRDLAAELLHWRDIEHYPLMTRWVWDHGTSTGVLREIWHDDADPALARVPDGYETFLVLREELAQYLSENGFFRDVPLYVDLLCGQVYASYICEQGGTYLRAEFASEHDPMQYVRRMLGLDGVDLEPGATRVKRVNGTAFKLDAGRH